MNLSKRGRENILLRRVRRHQSMTTLFRALDTDGARLPYEAGKAPVAQSSLQVLPVNATLDSTDSSVRSAAPVAPVVARQVVSLPASVNDSTDSKPPESVSSTAASSGADPVWRQLQTIFRKHQEQANADTFHATESATAEPGIVQPAADHVPPGQGKRKQKQGISPIPEAIFRKHQEQANADTSSDTDSATAETGTIQPAADHVPHGHDELKLGHDIPQSPGTILSKHQEQTEPQTLTVPAFAMPETQFVEAVHTAPHNNDEPAQKKGIWQGLKTIFRKYQDQGKSKTPETPATATPAIEPTESGPIRSLTNKESPGDVAETMSSEQPSLPFQSLATPNVSARPVQRSTENVENKPHSAVSKGRGKDQPILSLPPEHPVQAEAIKAPSGGQFPEDAPTPPDPAPSTHRIQRQASPLESVWKVERIEASESRSDEPIARPHPSPITPVESTFSKETDPAHEQPTDMSEMVFHHEQKHPMETGNPQAKQMLVSDSQVAPQAPVEILSPSRPRPGPPSATPSGPTLQRAPENRHTTDEIKESAFVNTVIGPLPSDLWSLLGQEPPPGAHQPEVQNQTPTRFSQDESSHHQAIFTSKHPSQPEGKSIGTDHLPDVIQRQAMTDNFLMSNGEEPGEDPQAEETADVDADLDDLTRRVYTQILHRFNVERERLRRR